MYTYTCPICGTVREVQTRKQMQEYCSRECYGIARRDQFVAERNHPMDEPVTDHFVHPKGFDNLVAAVCEQARHDFLTNPPGNYMREDAKRFFLSDEFAVLSQLDGENIVRRLDEEYRIRQTRRRMKHGYGK